MYRLSEPRLEAIFRHILHLSPSSDVTTLTQRDVPEWDSLAHVSLVLAIEDEFGVQVDASDALELTSYEAVSRFLEGNGS